MIHVDRSSIPLPRVFNSSRLRTAHEKLRAFFALPPDQRPQTRMFDRVAQRESRSALGRLFNNKCAYCEVRIALTNVLDVDRYRPKALAGDPDARDHYWWLAYEWSNFLPACRACGSAKRDLFPIGGPRVPALTKDEVGLAKELALLLDPTRDHPEEYLVFDADGYLRPRASNNADSLATRRAATTIEILQLNRPTLVAERHRAVARMGTLLNRLESAPSSRAATMRSILRSLEPTEEYAGACRSFCARHAEALFRHASARDQRRLASMDWFRIDRQERRRTQKKPRLKSSPAGVMAALPLNVAPPVTPIVPRSITLATITRVTVEQFRLIEKIEFSVPEQRPPDLRSLDWEQVSTADIVGRNCGWKMLLGENGAGKTSILQAIAVALMGREFYERNVQRYHLDACLRHGADTGRIEIRCAQLNQPIEVEIADKDIKWTQSPAGVNLFLRGYGATRLLPRAGISFTPFSPGLQQRNVDNLFDPYAALVDAEGWLRQLEEHDFAKVCLTLKDLLDVPPEENLAFAEPRATGRFGLMRGNHFTPLDHFSAGYQTILVLACDIMAGTGAAIGEMSAQPGIILIDEVGTNLHPRWRLEILTRLERAFPAMQFIASTHEPLCLRGLGGGEVAVVSRRGAAVELVDNLPSPADLRVDQLLTSSFFGLHTAYDPQLEQEFDTYYSLLAREAELTAPERALRDRLEERLAHRSVLGASRRDRIILRAVDNFLARQGNRPVRDDGDLSPEVREIIERALSEVEPSGEPAP